VRSLLPPDAPFEVNCQLAGRSSILIQGKRGAEIDPDAFRSHVEACIDELLDQGLPLELEGLARTITSASYAVEQVYNGGVSQLFYNANNNDRPIDPMIEALETIGASAAAQALVNARIRLNQRGPEELLEGDYFDDDKKAARESLDDYSAVFYSGTPSARSILSEWIFAQCDTAPVKKLLAEFGPLPAPDETRDVLERAVRESNVDAVRRVLDSGFDPDTPDTWNVTALAKLEHNTEPSLQDLAIARALYEAGADPWRTSTDGRCVLHVPAFRRELSEAGFDFEARKQELAGAFRNAAEVRAAHEAGLQLDASAFNRDSFIYAFNTPEDTRAVVAALREAGIAIEELDPATWSWAMHRAEVVSVLRAEGARVTGAAPDPKNGWTTVHDAALGEPGVLEQLLDEGADMGLRTTAATWQYFDAPRDGEKRGWLPAGATPLDVARFKQNQACIDLLEARDAPTGQAPGHCVALTARGDRDRELLDLLGEVDHKSLAQVGRRNADEWLASPMIVRSGLSPADARALVDRIEALGAKAVVV
jgi:hypothetical protein